MPSSKACYTYDPLTTLTEKKTNNKKLIQGPSCRRVRRESQVSDLAKKLIKKNYQKKKLIQGPSCGRVRRETQVPDQYLGNPLRHFFFANIFFII